MLTLNLDFHLWRVHFHPRHFRTVRLSRRAKYGPSQTPLPPSLSSVQYAGLVIVDLFVAAHCGRSEYRGLYGMHSRGRLEWEVKGMSCC